MSNADEIWMNAPILLKSNRLSSRQGDHSVTTRGNGMNFKEVRSYQYGDDIRNIDWNVSARMQDTYVKVFEEEVDRQAWLLLDISSSVIRTPLHHKKISSVLASIAKTLAPSGYNIGAVFFHNLITQVFPPKTGLLHAQRIYQQYYHEQAGITTTTQIELAIQYLLQRKLSKVQIFILSDFLSSDYATHLAQLASGCEVHAIMVSGFSHHTIKNIGLLPIQDIEGENLEWWDTNEMNADIVAFQEHLSQTKKICQSAGARFHHLDIETSNQKIIL